MASDKRAPVSMTVREKQNRIDKLSKSISKAWSEVYALRSELAKSCDHRVTEDYPWEHDNGYGRQTKMVGWRCVYCLAKNHYKNIGSWTQE